MLQLALLTPFFVFLLLNGDSFAPACPLFYSVCSVTLCLYGLICGGEKSENKLLLFLGLCPSGLSRDMLLKQHWIATSIMRSVIMFAMSVRKVITMQAHFD